MTVPDTEPKEPATMGVQAFVRNPDQPAPSLDLLKPVTRGKRDYDWVKPNGGLWTSTWSPDFGSGWIDWCIGESFAGPEFYVWLLTPEPDANLYEVDSLADLVALCDRFPGTDDRRGSNREYPCWEALAREYDGLHLTDAGQWATRMSHPQNLYGWDCESTLWFRWKFAEVTIHGDWHAPMVPCDRPDDDYCYRCYADERRHMLTRSDREELLAVDRG